ncbi:MAG: ATP synthase F1 subunit epsilon [Pseudomonadota bacterium]
MADTMNFEIVSPEARLAAVEAQSVTVPGAEGELTAMPMHAPFLTALRPGVVTVRTGTSEDRYVVTGGFVEITGEQVGVIAQDAATADAVDRAWIDTRIAAAEKALEAAPEARRTAEAQRLADIRQLAVELGL